MSSAVKRSVRKSATSDPSAWVWEPTALVNWLSSKMPVSSAKKQNSSRVKKTLSACRPCGSLEHLGVRGEQLVEELAHPLGGLDVGVRLGDVLRLLHAGPGQEEREVLVDVPDRDHQVLAGLRVDGEQLGVVGDDHEAGAVPHDRRRGLQLVDDRERVAGRLLEVDDVLLRDLGRRVVGDVERAVAQARDVALELAVGEQQTRR